MLVLSRKEHESFEIGNNIFVKILHLDKNVVKIGIDAPIDIKIMRTELVDPKDIRDQQKRSNR